MISSLHLNACKPLSESLFTISELTTDNYTCHCHYLCPATEFPSKFLLTKKASTRPSVTYNSTLQAQSRVEVDLQFECLLRTQSLNRFHNQQASNLTDRLSCIALMRSFASMFDFNKSTLFLGIACFDAILAMYSVDQTQLKLVVFVTLYLAAKMEENESKIPPITRGIFLLEVFFSKQQIQECENFIFEILGFNLHIKTPFSFLTFLMAETLINETDFQKNKINSKSLKNASKKLNDLIWHLHDITINNYQYNQFTSLAVTCSIIGNARRLLGLKRWNGHLEGLTRLSEKSLMSCFETLQRSIEETPCNHPVTAAPNSTPVCTPQKELTEMDTAMETEISSPVFSFETQESGSFLEGLGAFEEGKKVDRKGSLNLTRLTGNKGKVLSRAEELKERILKELKGSATSENCFSRKDVFPSK